MMYAILDRQNPGRYFADRALFKSTDAVLEQLIDYHEIDWDAEDGDIQNMTLEDILEYGEWEIEEVLPLYCNLCGEPKYEDISEFELVCASCKKEAGLK